jgi:hypothetical protein
VRVGGVAPDRHVGPVVRRSSPARANASRIQRCTSCSCSGAARAPARPAHANASRASPGDDRRRAAVRASCAGVQTARGGSPARPLVATVAPCARTISSTPAGTRSTYGTASPGEYSIATRRPATSPPERAPRARATSCTRPSPTPPATSSTAPARSRASPPPARPRAAPARRSAA